MRNSHLARRRAPQQGSDGFTLVEVVLAMFIVLVVLTTMVGLLLSSLTTITQARQRQTATAIATQAMERLRALPYDDVTQSDGSSPDVSIQHLVAVGAAWNFRPSAVLPGVDEPLVVNTRSGRVTSQTVDGVAYRVQTYVTRAAATPAGQQAFNATVLVSWSSSVFENERSTAQRSTLFSPAGCLSTAQSPFAAPCQAYFTAQAGAALGGFSIVNADDSSLPIEGVGGMSLELGLSRHSASLLVEQTASANAESGTTGVRAADGVSAAESGSQTASAAVDSDPSTPALLPASADTPSQTATARTLSSSTGGTLRATPTTGDSGRAMAAIEAPSSTCISSTGAPLVTGPTDLRPCGSSRIRPSGSAGSMTYTPPSAFGFSSVDVPLVTFTGAPSESRAVATQLTASNADACTATGGPGLAGCSHGASSRSLGTVTVAGSTSGAAAPVGWDAARGLWRLSGLTERAVTEEGTSARTPTYTRTGTLEVWNGTGYTTVDLSAYASPPGGATPASETWTLPMTQMTYASPSGAQMTVTYEGTLTIQRPTVERTPSTRTGDVVTDCKAEACVSRLNGGGSVVSNVTVTIQRIGDPNPTAKFAIAGNLGGLVAQATYKAAPNA